METGILLPHISEKKSKKSKTTDVRSSDTKVKSLKKMKQVPVIEPKPIQLEPVIPDTQVTEKEVIPSKAGVFKRIKMKSKRSEDHQRMVVDMAKHISKKKKHKLILSSDSTADEIEVIPETPEPVLINEPFKVDTLVTQPPEV
ncbi:unnamed protein product [Lactuca saligna]|uniref:Uncharacterized protein n=1 Tax=Lactuca saligna TaxID=75948 RepID=A0AA36E5I4_LACSI|nr:unnamed protein product [Lactuca saligna]